LAKKILVVDDSPTVLKVLEHSFQAGFDHHGSEYVGNGRHPIHPRNSQFIPAVMLTTESQQSKRDEAKSAGATGWIVKPFKHDSLLRVVRQLVLGA
jgi:CheY-like chemotaxis protein